MNKVHIVLECEDMADCDDAASAITLLLQNKGKKMGINGWAVEGLHFKARTSHTKVNETSREILNKLHLKEGK